MAKANVTWTVLPHDPIEKLSDRVWRVQGAIGRGPIRRVMTVVQRADGGLIVHNAMALEASAMAELDAWGKVALVVVPNGLHRLDAPLFHARYPTAEVACPAGSRGRVEEVVPVTRTYDELADDGVVAFETLDGTKQREGAMVVREPSGATLVLNDAVFNMPHGSGPSGFVLRYLTASSGGPRVSRIAKLLMISDKRAFRAHLERLAAVPDLRRVIVSHHLVIDDDPAGALRTAAAAL